MTAKPPTDVNDEMADLTWAQIAEGHSNDPRAHFLPALIVYLLDSDIPPNEENITNILEFIRSLEAL